MAKGIFITFEGIEGCFGRAGKTRQLRLHGDFHPGNVLAAGDQLHIVDLDDTRRGPAVQDLGLVETALPVEHPGQSAQRVERIGSAVPAGAAEAVDGLEKKALRLLVPSQLQEQGPPVDHCRKDLGMIRAQDVTSQ